MTHDVNKEFLLTGYLFFISDEVGGDCIDVGENVHNALFQYFPMLLAFALILDMHQPIPLQRQYRAQRHQIRTHIRHFGLILCSYGDRPNKSEQCVFTFH